jgi:hypothetical protein
MDDVKFTWEVTFRQKQNGMTQQKLLKSFLERVTELNRHFAQEHHLTSMESRVTVKREAVTDPQRPSKMRRGE